MRKLITILVLISIIIGVGYYFYSHRTSGFFGSVFSSSTDAVTTSKVKAALMLSRRVKSYNIGVTTNGGVVNLTGEVASEDAKSLAGEIARDTPGVNEVKNEIVVNSGAQPSSESVRVNDLEIRVAILEALTHSPELGGKSIGVKVDNGVVTLSGSVETPAQRNGAEQTARAIDGVTGITDNLSVVNPEAPTEPPATSASPVEPTGGDIAKRVEFELYRTGAFDTLSMTVRAQESSITLSGTVRSRAEQLLAERIARDTPGVKQVVNQLRLAARH